MAFYEGDLQSGIALAVQTSKAVLCFIVDTSEATEAWEDILKANEQIPSKAVALRLEKDKQEYNFLHSFCPITSTPAIIVIKNGSIQANLQSHEVVREELESRLQAFFSEDVPVGTTSARTPITETRNPSVQSSAIAGEAGRNNASHQAQTSSTTQPAPLTESNAMAASSTRRTVPASDVEQALQSQRQNHVKMQKEREQKQRDERERIKQQIKADREERRRRDQIGKQNEPQSPTLSDTDSNIAQKKSDIRVQVRNFDGSTLRNTFLPSASVAQDVRPWIDEATAQKVPYNLKQILTPFPNRNIEASEEEQSLVDLGIRGSSTLVMVPVQGYVESYTGSMPGGLMGSVVSGGYNLVTGTAGAFLGGVTSLLGYGTTANPSTPAEQINDSDGPSVPQVRVRTLADQRAEATKKDQKFYNGNSLNFESRKDQDGKKED